MNETIQALVKGFINRLVDGSLLDDCGNRNDDSLSEIADRCSVDHYVAVNLREIDRVAKRLQALIKESE